MDDTLIYAGTLVVRRCWCGIRHAIPSELNRALDLDPKQAAYCPLGHSYVSTTHDQRESEQLRAQLTRTNARLDQARAEAEHERRRTNGYKGQLTKTKKRIAKGVCPCCNRQFVNVEKHMSNQHPDYGSD